MESLSPLVEGLRLERRDHAAGLNHHAGSGKMVQVGAARQTRQTGGVIAIFRRVVCAGHG